MALPASRQANNIQLSVQRQITNVGTSEITVDGTDYTVYPGRWGDPDAAGSPATIPDLAFLTATWLQSRAGRKGSSVLQIDVWSRIQAPDDALGDPLGLRANDIADAVEEVFTGTNAAGALNACIRILDFAIPAVPVDTDDWMACKSADGMLGESDDRTPAYEDGSFWRISLSFRFWASRDLSAAGNLYYDQ